MSYLRSRNAVILAKVEVTEGVDASPTGTDAVLVENVRGPTPNPNITNTNEVTGSLDGFGRIVGGMTFGISFDVYLKGSGTAGTAPEFGPLLKACGWAETATATAVPSSAEAVGSGSTDTEVVLGTSASSTDDTYLGMPLQLSGDLTDLSFVSDYVGSTKTATVTDTLTGTPAAATTEYQIPKNVLYLPTSSSISSITIYAYLDGKLTKMLGCRGTMQLSLTSGGPAKMSFSFTGMFSAESDTAIVSPTYDTTRPPIWKGGKALINRLAAAMQGLSITNGNTLASPDNPNATEGVDPAIITMRNITGTMNPVERLVATDDVMTDFRSGNKRIVHASYGSTAGNKVGITIPSALYTGKNPTDRSGIAAVDIPFDCVGQNQGAAICLY